MQVLAVSHGMLINRQLSTKTEIDLYDDRQWAATLGKELMDRSEIENSVQTLYFGILGRAADADGLKYWVDQIVAGRMGLDNTRVAFTTAPEYLSIYNGLSSTAFATKVYQNLLSRDPDVPGLNYWVNELDTGRVSADNFVLAVITAAQQNAAEDAQVLLNKLDVANSFTSQSSRKKADTEFTQAAQQVMEKITDNAHSATQAKALIGESVAALNDRFIFSIDYENNNVGAYTLADLEKSVGSGGDSMNIFGRAEVVDVDNHHQLLVTLEAGRVKNGIQFYKKLGDFDALYLSYEITYLEGFDWTAGSKAPGLGTVVDGVGNPTGDTPIGIDDGYSVRMMVREEGTANQYIHDQFKTGKAGVDIPLTSNSQPYLFEIGKKTKVDLYVKVNTPGIADGEILSTIDGEQVLHETNKIFSQSGNYGVQDLFFDIWHGGQGAAFEPSVDSQVLIDNIGISTDPILTQHYYL